MIKLINIMEYKTGITVGCLICRKPVAQVIGKRQRKYCSDSCRQKAYQTANKVQMVSISKVEYDRLRQIEVDYLLLKITPNLAKTTNEPTLEGSFEFHQELNKPFTGNLKDVGVNTKQKKIKGKSNGVESRTDDSNMNASTAGMKLHESLGAVFLPKPNNKPDRLPGESTIDYKIRTAG